MVEKLIRILNLPPPLQEIKFSLWKELDLQIFFKRDDLIHKAVSGNKWRKLYGHLLKYQKGEYQGVLTFGGAFSNHIVATAAACNTSNLPCYGVIRGEIQPDNPALKFASENNMILLPLERREYRNKNLNPLIERFPSIPFHNLMIVPEGGGGKEGMTGCAEIVNEINLDYEYIVSAAGTGTTVAGLAKYTSDHARIIGISVLKGEDTLTESVYRLSGKNNFEIITGYHFGGYARYTEELLSFARKFTQETGVPLDYVYTAKMVFAFDKLLHDDFFKPKSKVILLHTGGLMNAGINQII